MQWWYMKMSPNARWMVDAGESADGLVNRAQIDFIK